MKTSVKMMLAVVLVLSLVSANALGAHAKPKKEKSAETTGVRGTIERIDTAASQITVKKEAGTDTLTITCGDKTRIQVKQNAAAKFAKSKLADLKDGMYTVVLYTTDGDKKVAKSIMTAPTKGVFKATGKPAGKGSKSGGKPEAK